MEENKNGNEGRLDTLIGNLHERAVSRGNISFDSPEERALSEQHLKSVFLKQYSIISSRFLLAEKARRRGRVGQSREETKFYKRESKQAKKELKEANRELQPIEKEMYEMFTRLRNYKTRRSKRY